MSQLIATIKISTEKLDCLRKLGIGQILKIEELETTPKISPREQRKLELSRRLDKVS